MPNRDEFSKTVIVTLAQRAGYVCSNPACRDPTSVPHSDPTKALITGEACHIRAAAVGGPRHLDSQTPEERKDIRNAIWLCTKCSTKVDKDWRPWQAERLLEMKEQHERSFISNFSTISQHFLDIFSTVRHASSTYLHACSRPASRSPARSPTPSWRSRRTGRL
jgi:hypothetical protein